MKIKLGFWLRLQNFPSKQAETFSPKRKQHMGSKQKEILQYQIPLIRKVTRKIPSSGSIKNLKHRNKKWVLTAINSYLMETSESKMEENGGHNSDEGKAYDDETYGSERWDSQVSLAPPMSLKLWLLLPNPGDRHFFTVKGFWERKSKA